MVSRAGLIVSTNPAFEQWNEVMGSERRRAYCWPA